MSKKTSKTAATTSTITNIEDIKQANIRRSLSLVCSEIAANNRSISELEKENAEHRKKLALLGRKMKLEKVVGDGWTLSKVARVFKKILPERLMERGVSLEDIEYATEVSRSESYQVRGTNDTGGE